MMMKIKSVYTNENVELEPTLALYEVRDFMGSNLHGLCIQLNGKCEEEDDFEPYQTLTVCFGEYIGVKNCAYIDTNNCKFADQLLKYGIAEDTGMTKHSGFCVYPLWQFHEDFLRSVNNDVYQRYSDEFDKYMGSF